MSIPKHTIKSILPDNQLSDTPFTDDVREDIIDERVQALELSEERRACSKNRSEANSKIAYLEQAQTPKPVTTAQVEDARRALEALNKSTADPGSVRAAAARALANQDIPVATPVEVTQVPTTQAPTTRVSTAQAVKNALDLQGASRADITRLLKSLNINTSVRLSKNDTSNLIACLLTCNETQLNAVMKNPKVPVVIKTVIKRILADSKDGYMDTIERLWDRIFGKTGMVQDLPDATQMQNGLLPNVPVSREAYILIRDTLM